MNLQELRIGNYVSMNFDKEGQEYIIPTIVKELSEVNCRVLSKGEVFVTHYDNIKPIPLTEDILLKCGFEKRVDNVCNESHFVLGKFIVRDDFVLCDIDIHVVITTLHQLQNLYFALTGEELNIEL